MLAIRTFLRALPRLITAGLAVCLALPALAERLEDLPAPTGYVSDYAHVLSPETQARLERLCTQLDQQAKAQVAVVTVRTIGDEDQADYSTRLYERMKIGKKGSDRGLLFFFAIDDHKRSIRTGYGLEGILPDGRTGDIGRAMVPYLRAGDYDSAVQLGVQQAAQIIAADAKVTLADDPDTGRVAQRPVRHGVSVIRIILLIVALLFFGGFFLLRMLLGFGLFGGWGGWGGGGGFGGGGFGGGGGGDSGGGFGGFGGGSTGGGGSDGGW
jgi:uncharacterized protein